MKFMLIAHLMFATMVLVCAVGRVPLDREAVFWAWVGLTAGTGIAFLPDGDI
jgi:hypothetical protein